MAIFNFACALMIICIVAGEQVQLIEPRSVNYNDAKDYKRMAISEKITANLIGALSYNIEYVPQHSGECKISSMRDHFRQIANRNLASGYYSKVTSIINLKKHNLTVMIDTNFYIAAFQINKGKFVDKVTNIALRTQSQQDQQIPLLVTDQNQTYILAVSSTYYYLINVSSIKQEKLQFKQFKQSIGQSIFKLEVFNDVLFVGTREAGIKAYKVHPGLGNLQFLYAIHNDKMICQDFAIQKVNKMLYLLDQERGIEVYNVSTTDKQPSLYDFLDLQTTTLKNFKIQIQNKVIIVAFKHRSQTVVAEFNYRVEEKKFSFVRYFKFKDVLIDIHLMDEHLIGVGDIFVAVFPVNIHPKLIQEEMNGKITLSPIRKVIQLDGPFFVGLTHDSLILGQIQVNNYDEMTCALSENSKLKKLIYRANITHCSSATRQYYDYCTYTKQVEFDKMDIVTKQGTAKTLWFSMLALFGCIILGIVFLYFLKRRKQRTIKFLEAEFEKRQSMVSLPSQRMSQRNEISNQQNVPPAEQFVPQ